MTQYFYFVIFDGKMGVMVNILLECFAKYFVLRANYTDKKDAFASRNRLRANLHLPDSQSYWLV